MVAWDEMRREGWVTKGHKETFRDNGYINIDYSDRFRPQVEVPTEGPGELETRGVAARV